VQEFVADHAPIHDGGYHTDRRGGEQDFQAGRVILFQECDALAALHTGSLKRSRGAANPRGPISPGPLHVAVVNRDAVGLVLRVPVDEAGERLRREGRGIDWWHRPSGGFADSGFGSTL
jgi:hypothetical protein